MDITLPALTDLSDAELLAEVQRLVAHERIATATLIRSLMELDARRLYLAEGCSSLFTYCTHVLHLSEHAALGRIEVARASRRLPAILDRLLDGSVTVTNARLLARHLTAENHIALLEAARHKSKRDVERIVAGLSPLPDVVASVRKLPVPKAATRIAVAHNPAGGDESLTPTPCLQPTTGAEPHDTPASVPSPLSTHRPIIAPLAPERYCVQLTVSREAHDKLRRAQDLLRHTIPSGDPAAIFERALTLLVEQLEKAMCSATTRPRASAGTQAGSRHVPAAVRREVWKRDEGRCAFVGLRGRCGERGFLEFHHVVPYAAGGAADAANIQLRCRAHNAFEADLFFGTDVVKEPTSAWD